MIARAPIASSAIVGRRRQSAQIGADFVVPFAVGGMVARDRRAMRTVDADGATVANQAELAVAVATSVAALSAGDRQRVIRIG